MCRKFDIGDFVTNKSNSWASGFKSNTNCNCKGNNCQDKIYCCDYMDRREEIGLNGIILEYKKMGSLGYKYLVEWEDCKGRCGKSEISLELNKTKMRNKKIKELLENEIK